MNKLHQIKCPVCNSKKTKVVLVKDCVSNQADIVRRRHCTECDHRFYTAQTEEEHIDKVEYGNHGKIILRIFYAKT